MATVLYSSRTNKTIPLNLILSLELQKDKPIFFKMFLHYSSIIVSAKVIFILQLGAQGCLHLPTHYPSAESIPNHFEFLFCETPFKCLIGFYCGHHKRETPPLLGYEAKIFCARNIIVRIFSYVTEGGRSGDRGGKLVCPKTSCRCTCSW